VSELREAFMLFDYNKSGKIASRDVGPVIRSVGLKPSEAEVQEIAQEISQTGGEVDLSTLIQLISKIVSNPPTEKSDELCEVFKSYDKENNGQLSIAEVKHLLTSVGEKLTDDEADELLKMTGCVHNGKVNYESKLSFHLILIIQEEF
ncbi:hypothetical protein HELRODRAFT_69120, partial [Helobdella robusta]|uniref:EF-hand domain-containing protein n=1 Tax=Helobdella robusta TaxID=6412 RepID=T1FZP9_HELRO